VCLKIDGMLFTTENQALGKKNNVPMTHCPTQIRKRPTWERIRDSVVEDQEANPAYVSRAKICGVLTGCLNQVGCHSATGASSELLLANYKPIH
jgi:hypothetical protein